MSRSRRDARGLRINYGVLVASLALCFVAASTSGAVRASGATVPGARVAGAGVAGAGVAGAAVPGAGVAGAAVPGAGVAGAAVPGAGVAGAAVPGAGVAGAAVPGALNASNAASAPATSGGLNSASAFGAATAIGGGTAAAGGAAVVGIAHSPDGRGYWLVASDGGIFSFGDAVFEGSTGAMHLNAPIVGMAATADGLGYWLVASDGGIFSFGDAMFEGSTGAMHLNAPIVGMAATADGLGYWLVASDGGIFSFGDAVFEGSTGAMHLNAPIVGMAATADGLGYWLVASDGGIFSFGDAVFEGSTGAMHLNAPIVGMAATADGLGYWLVASDGGIFSFGDAEFFGSGAGAPSATEAVGIAAVADGYWIAYGAEQPSPVPAIASYVAGRADNVTVAVDDLVTGQMFSFRPGVVEHTASTVKVDILATLLREAQAAGRSLTPEEQSLAVPMIEESLDSAADALWVQLGPAAVAATEQAVGMQSTVPPTNGIWGTTTTTAADRLAMIRAVVFANPVLSDESRAYILNLMEHITPSQAWGISGGVPAGVTVALKNGFAIINGWQINSAGWVDGQGRDYLIAILTDGNSSEQYGIDTGERRLFDRLELPRLIARGWPVGRSRFEWRWSL